jgi:hypothetical protein
MNRIIRKRTELFVLAVLLLTCICQTGAATESTVSISPQTVTVSQGDTCTLDIVVDPVGNEVYRAECTLRFDNTMLKANDQSKKGSFLSSDDTETVEMLNGVNNAIGKIEYGETRRGGVGGVTESGILTSISFEALRQGTCDLTLEASLYDSDTHPIGVVVVNGTCIVGESTGVTTTATEEPADSASATATTTDEHPERPSTKNTIPGFGVVCSIAGLVVASLLASKGK